MKKSFLPLFLLFLILAGCSSLTLKPGDFSWPVESALDINSKGVVHDERYVVSFNVKALLFAELKDSVTIPNTKIRLIRDTRGFYFITAPKFKNVYVFEQADGGLKLANTLLVAPNGLYAPAFNKRSGLIELVDEKNPTLLLTKEGIQEGSKK